MRKPTDKEKLKIYTEGLKLLNSGIYKDGKELCFILSDIIGDVLNLESFVRTYIDEQPHSYFPEIWAERNKKYMKEYHNGYWWDIDKERIVALKNAIQRVKKKIAEKKLAK